MNAVPPAAPVRPMTKQEVAQRLGVSVRTVEIWCSSGEIPPPAHIGRKPFWHPAEFDKWLDRKLRGEQPPATGPAGDSAAAPMGPVVSSKPVRAERSPAVERAKARAAQRTARLAGD